ncbi:amidohydrolase family protein [Aeromicrobium yanjiei]|uniref:Amidohydrolase family protein n=1 Tax=Aeromicrobium yanjiei TaxID=2662028 RepID=A0A5Q2MEJ3_9ACTN|nr:amidohydrolase family protein [Aeromicrobium yanjiei]QGG41524.1 amidohydrolase family protein [Aeromicrobium yanjiei]
MSLFVREAEVAGRIVDVRITGGVVTALAGKLRPTVGDLVVEADGGALIPGLHDHHLHLLAMAAAMQSVSCGPPAVTDGAQLRESLERAAEGLAPGEWLRGVGYHESVNGPLDRHTLDGLVAGVPIRVQHRSGALWVLNSAALRLVGPHLDRSADVERDEQGRPTGRLWRYDARLRDILGAQSPDLRKVGERLTSLGITGVTDATPDLDAAGRQIVVDAVDSGRLPVRVHLLGTPAPDAHTPGVTYGPRKLLLRDHDLPALDDLAATISGVHSTGTPVAVHCVTRESLLLTLVAIEQVGPLPGDRIEHAAVVPPEVTEWIARLGLRVVTQPGFIAERGDQYLSDVDPADHPLLYPYGSLLGAGIDVAPSSDAPYGPLDPWETMRSAASRSTAAGRIITPAERVSPATVLDGYLSDPETPGGAPRQVVVGAPADLCLLDDRLEQVLADPRAGRIRLVIRAGVVIDPRH